MFTGCGVSSVDSWQDVTEFGDININAEVVDTNDVDTEYEIDEYIKISELNNTKMDLATVDSLRIYYNRIAEQFGVPYLSATGYETEEINESITKYVYEEDGTGAYINADAQTGVVSNAYFEIMFNDNNEELFRTSVGRLMSPVYGFIPNMKKYDLNEAYLGICDAMEDEKGKYEYEFNGIKLEMQRDYGYVYVTITFPSQY